MSKKSAANKIVRKSAGEIPRATQANLDRLRAAMHASIDTSETPERKEFRRLQRAANGKLPPLKSSIDEASA